MKLVFPAIEYKESFLEALKEFQKENWDDLVDYHKLDLEAVRSNFSGFIEKLIAESRGENLPVRYVPQTTYWLVDNEEFIGRATIRHQLTATLLQEGGHIGYDIRPSKRGQGLGNKILALALPKAKELGIHKALVTCNENNIRSKKIIEANGGVFENKLKFHEDKPAKLRYWIAIK